MSDVFKQQAAEYTVDHFIQSGMVLGLGVGSTAIHALRRLAERLKTGELSNIVGVPCAQRVEDEARALGIPLTTLDTHPRLDLTFDGADEVDPHLNLIKGGGGALLREKIVAQASEQEIIMVDATKLVPVLGTSWAVPIEVIPFGLGAQQLFLQEVGGAPVLRQNPDGSIYHTDQGNYILDTQFGIIADPHALATQLNNRAGIVEHGLFLGLATAVVVADENGVRVIERKS